MTLQEKSDALPPYPSAADPISDGMFYRRMSAAYSQRLSLAREWVDRSEHRPGCMYPCTCGRDALLKALERPR